MAQAIPIIAAGATLASAGVGAAAAAGAFSPKLPKPVTPVNPLDNTSQLAAARAGEVEQMQRRSLLGSTFAGSGAAPAPGSIGTKTLLGS